MNTNSSLTLSGEVTFKVHRVGQPCSLLWKLRNLPHVLKGAWRYHLASLLGLPTLAGRLYVRVFKADGRVINYGLISTRVVTTTGVNYIVDAFQNSVELENMRYHGFGTGTGAEAVGNTTLGTELTTEYNPDNTRPTGSLTEGATANIFKTIATLTIDSGTPAITEHGILSQAAVGGGVLLDRSLFAAINLVAGDSIEATYQLTLTAGG